MIDNTGKLCCYAELFQLSDDAVVRLEFRRRDLDMEPWR